ncbi:MAG: ATP-binding cassette domain-containing protein, partial [Anaerolineae bacterium]|nr:ATP-binding cassette domain-containing protein [Anaerolineae bacterium]
AGEVVGVAGLVGAGRTQLARVLFGIDQPEAGTILLDGRPTRFRNPRDAIRAGIAYVPEDRKGLGLVLGASVGFNLALTLLRELSRFGVLRASQLDALYRTWVERLRIRTPSAQTIVENLSGGNQQKVVLAKWLARQPRVLILNEPTRGIDVGAKAEVHALIREVAARGVAVMMISSELPEIMTISDRIVVMWNGRTVGELDGRTALEEEVLALAFGELGHSHRAG